MAATMNMYKTMLLHLVCLSISLIEQANTLWTNERTLEHYSTTTSTGWTQQYGDSSSTSYTEFVDTGQFVSGWNYTTPSFVSQTSPSVNEHGVIFYPLRADVIAIAPNGSTVWKCSVSPNGNSYLTNTVYTKTHNLVIVGSTWVQQNTYFQFVAINATSGNVVWTKMLNELYHPTSISISDKTDSVFAAGIDKNTFAAVKITNGEILWEKKHINQVGIFMQTKVGNGVSLKLPILSDITRVLNATATNSEIVLLPTNPWDGFEGKGRLFAYDTTGGIFHTPPHVCWYTDLGFTAGALFAFSSVGVLYGSNSGSEGKLGALFVANLTTGNMIYNDNGWCDRGAAGLSGPAVDQYGYAYFSCGNQMFCLNSDGSLHWQSEKFGNSTLGSVVPPSIHPDGHAYFIHQNGTVVFCLRTKDGVLDRTYNTPRLGYFEPPILIGAKFMYLIGFDGNSVMIMPVAL